EGTKPPDLESGPFDRLGTPATKENSQGMVFIRTRPRTHPFPLPKSPIGGLVRKDLNESKE
ncbi:MAG: hypothetical protein AABY11_01890, partial [archaeon]